jgi:hypothetical protein
MYTYFICNVYGCNEDWQDARCIYYEVVVSSENHTNIEIHRVGKMQSSLMTEQVEHILTNLF